MNDNPLKDDLLEREHTDFLPPWSKTIATKLLYPFECIWEGVTRFMTMVIIVGGFIGLMVLTVGLPGFAIHMFGAGHWGWGIGFVVATFWWFGFLFKLDD